MSFSCFFLLWENILRNRKNNRDTGKQLHKIIHNHLQFKTRTQNLYHPFCNIFLQAYTRAVKPLITSQTSNAR